MIALDAKKLHENLSEAGESDGGLKSGNPYLLKNIINPALMHEGNILPVQDVDFSKFSIDDINYIRLGLEKWKKCCCEISHAVSMLRQCAPIPSAPDFF